MSIRKEVGAGWDKKKKKKKKKRKTRKVMNGGRRRSKENVGHGLPFALWLRPPAIAAPLPIGSPPFTTPRPRPLSWSCSDSPGLTYFSLTASYIFPYQLNSINLTLI